MPQRNHLRLYFFEFGTPSNKPKYANKQQTKTTRKIFQNALKLYLLNENLNKFPRTHGPRLPKDGFVHKLLQINST